MKARYKPGTFITVPSKFRLAELDGLAQSVYMWLCDHADKNTGLCYPSIERLAKLIKKSKNTVRNRLGKLEVAGLIVRTRRKKENGMNMPNLYRVLEDNFVPKERRSSIVALHGSGNEQGVGQELGTNHNQYKQKSDNKRENTLTVPRLEQTTPGEFAETFFAQKSMRDVTVSTISGSFNLERNLVEREINKFVAYWTEPNTTGTKVRWQLQQTFDVKRRLSTWFSRMRTDKRSGAGITI